MEFHINSLKLGTLAQAKPPASLRLIHLAWASLKQQQHPVISPRRDHLSPKPLIQSRLGYKPRKHITHDHDISLRRGRLARARPWFAQHTKLLAWTRIRAQNPHVTSRSHLGERLSPKREAIRSTPIPGRLGEKGEPIPQHETLQLSPRW